MKYFELFELKPVLNIDLELLENKFHRLSKQYHPDFHTNSSEEKQEQALEMTALLNDAYRTLKDSTRRAEYLVKSQGFKVDGNNVPKTMLMEVFEINEGLDELRSARKSGNSVESLLKLVNDFQGQIAKKRLAYETQLENAFVEWDELVLNASTDEERSIHLAKLADIISQSSYIRNLERELDDEVSH